MNPEFCKPKSPVKHEFWPTLQKFYRPCENSVC